jgi:hypothetical protein
LAEAAIDQEVVIGQVNGNDHTDCQGAVFYNGNLFGTSDG